MIDQYSSVCVRTNERIEFDQQTVIDTEMQIICEDNDEVRSPMFGFVGNWFANGPGCSLSRDKVSVETKLTDHRHDYA